MNIHFAHTTFVTDGGEGITNNIVALKAALERRGFQVSDDGPRAKLHQLNQKTVRVQKSLEAIPFFFNALMGDPDDIVHFHLAVPNQALLVRLAACLARVPRRRRVGHLWNAIAEPEDLVITGSASESRWHGLLNGSRFSALGLEAFATVVVSSAHQERQLRKAGYAGTISRIPNGVDVARFSPADDTQRLSARQELGLPADAQTIVYFGHLTPWKGVRHLIEAFAPVAAVHPAALLVIARTSYGTEELVIRRRLAELGLTSRCVFLGKLDPACLLHAADAVVAPNVATVGTAVFPNVVLETLAAGVPLVTTSVPTHREILADGVHGLLVPPAQPDPLARALLELLASPALRARLGAEGRGLAVRQFDWDKVAGGFAQLYSSLLPAARAA
ncbi:MAG: glycosyltransferase family 4 protein [Chloroflexota bacterium]